MLNTDRPTIIKEIIENSELFTYEELNLYSDIDLEEAHRALLFIIKIKRNDPPNDSVGN